MTDVTAEPLLTLSQAAAMLSVSPRYLRGLAKEGTLPSVRFGRLLRFRQEDLRAYIDQNVTVTL